MKTNFAWIDSKIFHDGTDFSWIFRGEVQQLHCYSPSSPVWPQKVPNQSCVACCSTPPAILEAAEGECSAFQNWLSDSTADWLHLVAALALVMDRIALTFGVLSRRVLSLAAFCLCNRELLIITRYNGALLIKVLQLEIHSDYVQRWTLNYILLTYLFIMCGRCCST